MERIIFCVEAVQLMKIGVPVIHFSKYLKCHKKKESLTK